MAVTFIARLRVGSRSTTKDIIFIFCLQYHKSCGRLRLDYPEVMIDCLPLVTEVMYERIFHGWSRKNEKVAIIIIALLLVVTVGFGR